MNKTKIEWADQTWNPVFGCKHNCFYCYAKKMNDRFKWIDKWTEPKFYPDRLKEPLKLRKPSVIFVGSMSDLWGEWVPDKWKTKVLDTVWKCYKQKKGHIFMFLTKNPKGYIGWAFPPLTWLGITIDGTEKKGIAREKLKILKDKFGSSNEGVYDYYKFISFEPLLGDVSYLNLKGVDLAIIGAMSGQGAIAPKKEWINNIKHDNIFYKNNIKKYL